MRERSIKVDTNTLIKLTGLYRSSDIARQIGVSRQLWHSYKTGKCDLPESTLDRLCAEYKLDKTKMVVEVI